MPGRPGHVLAARRRDVAPLVGLGRHPPHRVEGDAGQRAHLGEVVGEGLGRRPAVAGARGGVEPGAPRGEVAVELLHRPEGRDRNQEVAPQEPHGVLDGALLVAGVGVAVPGLEAVVGPELRERPRLGDLAADHPARLGGVVEDHHPGGAPPALEYLGQPRAHALRRLRARRDALAVVRARQRRRQQLEVELLAGDDGAEVAVVGLAGPRRPLELQVALAAARRPRLPPVEHEPADRRVGPLVAPLVDEPVEDPLGGVALLAGRTEVGLEHRLDPGLVALERWPPPPLGQRGLRRHVLHVGVLRDGVAAHPQSLRDLRPRHAVGVHRAYIIPYVQGHGHLLHPSRAGSPKLPPGKPYDEGRAPGPGTRPT